MPEAPKTADRSHGHDCVVDSPSAGGARPPVSCLGGLCRALAFRVATVLALICGTLAAPSAANASSVIAGSIEEMAMDADAVFLGRVTDQWTVVRSGRLATHVELQALEWLKAPDGESAAPTTVSLLARGGRWGDLATRVSGADTYLTGELVVVFARRSDSAPESVENAPTTSVYDDDSGERWESIALAWSSFAVTGSEHSDIASRDTRGLALLKRTTAGLRPVSVEDTESTLTVGELRDRIADALGGAQ